MGRYVGNKWVESLPSAGPQDQVQGNSVPVSSGGGSGGGSSAPEITAAPSSGGGQAQYNTKNGLQTLATMASQLKGVGWGGNTSDPNAVIAAYQSTTGGSVSPSGTSFSGGAADASGAGGGGGGASTPGQQLGGSIDQLLSALQSGNAAAAAEAAREFNQTFGLDQKKFEQAITEYNQNFGLQQAAVTGTYNGQQTLAAQKQAADIAAQAAGLTGYFNGAPTLATRQLGLSALDLASKLQADPFRQQQVINGLNAGGYSKAIDALNGNGNQPAFQAPTGSAADTATIPSLANRIATAGSSSGLFNSGSTADGADPVANAISGASAGSDNAQMNASLAALPDPNKIVARNFLKEDPTTQAFVLSGESAKTGEDMNTVKSQIQSTLPSFDAPTGMVEA